MDLHPAISNGIVFLSYFSELPDRRQALKVRYPLEEVLLLCLVAMICDCNCVSEIARFGEKRLELLRRFSRYTYGTPCEDQLGVILASLDVGAFQACFARWVAAVTGRPADVIAIDGKTSRRSGTKGNKDALHTLSAFAARQKLVLGQVKVSEKSNEITAIPKLLDMLSIEGAVVTIDAMGCQKEVARKIVDKQADYILALKGNQGTLHEDVKLFAAEQIERRFADCRHDMHRTVDGEHGRIETRSVHVLSDIGWLAERHDWTGLASIVMVDSLREINGKSQSETRFYITSLTASAADIAAYVRDHWAVENSLHWVLDMSFRDDESRVRTNNAPAIFAIIRHITANLLRLAPGKDSINLKRKTANWDDKYLEAIIRKN
jgi:predicted transposase YbfD/YdcC